MNLNKDKITLVLDLDETLVHCTPLDGHFDVSINIKISNNEFIQTGLNI